MTRSAGEPGGSSGADPADPVPTSWRRTATISRGGAITLSLLFGLALAVMIVGAVMGFRAEGRVPIPLWIALAILVPVTAVAFASLRFDVRIDASGVLARAPFGWPRARVPLEKITSADVVQVSPLADFGGWGWRTVGAGDGIVLRAGEAIRIGRERRSDLTITVDDAATAVAVLEAHRRRDARDSA